MEDSGPNAIDELSPEDYLYFWELQMWLYQSKGDSALGMSTHHPTLEVNPYEIVAIRCS